MQRLSWAELESETDALDAVVVRTPQIDRYCSSSLWAMPAHLAMAPRRDPWLWRSSAGYVLLAGEKDERGLRVLQPLEPMWGLGCPLLGEPEALCADFVRAFLADDADAALVTGVEDGSRCFRALVREVGRRARVLRGQESRRWLASLEGGLDGFLGRRSRNLRKALRRGAREADSVGVSFERAQGEPAALYARVLAAETRSWKGQEGTGLATPEMRDFYADQVPRLFRRGALRLIFARREERDVGFILGGVLGDTYRGLQFSYDSELHHLGLGGLLQVEQIGDLCAEGIAVYDLGSDVPYKQRWGERTHDTCMLAVVR